MFLSFKRFKLVIQGIGRLLVSCRFVRMYIVAKSYLCVNVHIIGNDINPLRLFSFEMLDHFLNPNGVVSFISPLSLSVCISNSESILTRVWRNGFIDSNFRVRIIGLDIADDEIQMPCNGRDTG